MPIRDAPNLQLITSPHTDRRARAPHCGAGRLQKVWNVPQNAIPQKIATAAQAGQPLGGYSPVDWVRWGETLLSLDVFLNTPITINLPDGSSETVTPESVLLTKYTPMEVAV